MHLFLVAMPGAPSSDALVPSSDARGAPSSDALVPSSDARGAPSSDALVPSSNCQEPLVAMHLFLVAIARSP